MRTAVYIDGFNLYYAALKGTQYKWLDISAFCTAVLPKNAKVCKIKYFTAKVSNRTGNDNKAGKQSIYLKALQAHNPELEVIYGHFSVHAMAARMVTPGGELDLRDIEPKGQQIAGSNRTIFHAQKQWKRDPGPLVHVIKTEEKGSDVNFAVHMVNDAWSKDYECLAVISNDSDLAEAMRIVKNERQKKVALITMESRRVADKLKNNATFIRTAKRINFEKNQLPNTIPNTKYSKPMDW